MMNRLEIMRIKRKGFLLVHQHCNEEELVIVRPFDWYNHTILSVTTKQLIQGLLRLTTQHALAEPAWWINHTRQQTVVLVLKSQLAVS